MSEKVKKKIAVLGGGVSSMAAVFGITSVPGWWHDYDITVYQMGWRIGGKGASGRNPDYDDRIEEHGLHVWLGFYENAFYVMRECYKELGRDPAAPLSTWDKAFTPWNMLVLQEHLKDTWNTLPMELPPNSSLPGDGTLLPTLWDYISMMIWVAKHYFEKTQHAQAAANTLEAHGLIDELPRWWNDTVGKLEHGLSDFAVKFAGNFLHLAQQIIDSIEYDPTQPQAQSAETFEPIKWLLVKFKAWLWDRVKDQIYTDQNIRLMWVTVDQMTANIYGMIHDGVLWNGFDSIDKYEYRQWLKNNTANDFTVDYALFQAAYDLVFGYTKGIADWAHGDMGAGTAIRGAIRMFFTYKGAVAWTMHAGMGDTVFGPFYEVLKRRGVKFKFFHRVKQLHLNEDGNLITAIDIAEQVKLKVGEYDPLVLVKDLPCWPSYPRYDQLERGDELRDKKVNLESAWADWEDADNDTLKLGDDFDIVIFGISLGSVKYLCKELVDRKPKWAAMVDKVKTVRTQAAQLWMKDDLKGLGWTATTEPPLMGAYAEPMSTWADLTHLIERENWPKDSQPKNLGYLVGVMPDDPNEPKPFTKHPDYPDTQLEKVFDTTRDWLEKFSGHLWPSATKPIGSSALNWDELVDSQGETGTNRLRAQYLRCNIDPSERYVLSVAGSLDYRMKTDETDVENLYVTGDWIRNGLNSGCVESATISGLQTSRAICAYPKNIVGEDDFLNTGKVLDPMGMVQREVKEIEEAVQKAPTLVQVGFVAAILATLGLLVSRVIGLFRKKSG